METLVTGLARSGTTWLAKILDSHPGTRYLHEPDSIPHFRGIPPVNVEPATAHYAEAINSTLRALEVESRVNSSGSWPVFRKSGETGLAFRQRQLAVLTLRLAAKRLGNFRMPGIAVHRNPEATLVWKSVLAVGHIQALASRRPGMRTVLILRHPCGVIESRERGASLGEMARLAPDHFQSLLSLDMPLVESLRARCDLNSRLDLESLRWAVLNSLAIDYLASTPAGLIVRYEDLTRAPIDETRKILDFMGLPWDAEVERFITASTGATSRRFYGISRIHQDVDPWRVNYREEIRRVNEIVSGTSAAAFYDEIRAGNLR
jgi:hypothetical protein